MINSVRNQFTLSEVALIFNALSFYDFDRDYNNAQRLKKGKHADYRPHDRNQVAHIQKALSQSLKKKKPIKVDTNGVLICTHAVKHVINNYIKFIQFIHYTNSTKHTNVGDIDVDRFKDLQTKLKKYAHQLIKHDKEPSYLLDQLSTIMMIAQHGNVRKAMDKLFKGLQIDHVHNKVKTTNTLSGIALDSVTKLNQDNDEDMFFIINSTLISIQKALAKNEAKHKKFLKKHKKSKIKPNNINAKISAHTQTHISELEFQNEDIFQKKRLKKFKQFKKQGLHFVILRQNGKTSKVRLRDVSKLNKLIKKYIKVHSEI